MKTQDIRTPGEGCKGDDCQESIMFTMTVTRDREQTNDQQLASAVHIESHCHNLGEIMAVTEALEGIHDELATQAHRGAAIAALRELRDILVDGFPKDGAQ